jgi:hypothetical protein
MESLKFRVDACPRVRKTSKGENEQEDCLRQTAGHEKLLVKPQNESRAKTKRPHVEITAHSCLPLSPSINKLSKADLPCCSYLNNPRSLT